MAKKITSSFAIVENSFLRTFAHITTKTVSYTHLNAVILLVAVGIIITESIEKLFHPVPVEGAAIAWTAGVGVVINAVTAWLFMKDKEKDLNVKGAYLHMAADTLVSVGVVISGIIIMYTGWTLVDPIIGLVIAVIIVISTWSLSLIHIYCKS